ncbi:MAG: flagellar motor protein MotB [Gallionellaceae bacterium]|jgi:chemotaxis protein MotB
MNGSREKKSLKRQIIVKRVRRTDHVRPLGAWKIAYADFVTAMMAFFLLMWLITVHSREDRQAIAQYFQTPLLVVFSGGQTDDINTSMVVGSYGDDRMKTSGQVRSGPPLSEQVSIAEKDARKLLRLQELERLQLLKRQLAQLIETDPKLSKYKSQLLLDLTTEGLRILIVDEKNRPMFEIGSAVLQLYTVEILREIGKVLNQVPNKIGLSGHTDATPYPRGGSGYSNWELSTDRANASRRELTAGGMDQSKILRVVGLSSSALFNPRDPYDAHNRRISIIVMNRETEKSVTQNVEQ